MLVNFLLRELLCFPSLRNVSFSGTNVWHRSASAKQKVFTISVFFLPKNNHWKISHSSFVSNIFLISSHSLKVNILLAFDYFSWYLKSCLKDFFLKNTTLKVNHKSANNCWLCSWNAVIPDFLQVYLVKWSV